MTNGDILRVFREKYGEIQVNDYRPLCETYIPKKRQGIVIWTEAGDVILYFPKEGGEGHYDEMSME